MLKFEARQNRAAQLHTTTSLAEGGSVTMDIDGHPHLLIDGAYKEGGGQVLRNTFSLSALLGRPIKAFNIRANRNRPGLMAQHLTGIRLVAEMFDGWLDGAELWSREVAFRPGRFVADRKQFTGDTGTAGSATLLIQISLPCLVFAPRETLVTFCGGTNALAAPQVDYCAMVFKPIVQRMGVEFDVDIERRGFFPLGGGVVHVRTKPVQDTLRPITMCERGKVKTIRIRSFVAGTIPKHVAERMNATARKMITDYLRKADEDQRVSVEEEIVEETDKAAVGNGTGLIITATTTTGCIFGGSALGERGKAAEKVAEEAAASILKDLQEGGCTDEYLQDQLIIFMALAKGTSKIKTGPLSLHTETSIFFTQLLTGATFKVTKADDAVNAYYIQCEGIGFVNPHFQTTPPVVATAPAPTSASVPSSAHPANEEEEEEAME